MCVPSCTCYITDGDGGWHLIYASFVWGQSMHGMGMFFFFLEGRPGTRSSQFGYQRLRSWGLQVDLVEGLKTGSTFSLLSPTRSSTYSQESEARSEVSSTLNVKVRCCSCPAPSCPSGHCTGRHVDGSLWGHWNHHREIFLPDISSLKRVGDLQALSVAPSYLEFAPGMVKVFLHPITRSLLMWCDP